MLLKADVEGCQVSQRPYQGTWEAANMKPWRTELNEDNNSESDSEMEDNEM